ncbi:MBL fold metallo-hydrolase [Bacillus sp. N9]
MWRRNNAPINESEYCPESIKTLWFTHLHSDHTLGYGQFLLGGWGQGRSKLTIYGPKGTKAFHEKIIDLYREDIEYRCSLGRSGAGILDVNIIEITEDGEVVNQHEMKVKAMAMEHNVPTYGYRFETTEGTVVISGDTAPHKGIMELAKDADVLVIDAALSKGKRSLALEKSGINFRKNTAHLQKQQK